jgi:uncharacterized protein (TIGR00255 family)
MKEREGNALAADILPRLEVIENSMAGIRLNSGHIVERYRSKLQERIKEVCSAGEECDDRVLREVALFAERQDITEELTRLQSHIDQFRLTVRSKEKSVGRTLDFLSQEMNREINTIGSKASDAEVAKEVISVKSELEKIREQIQNIE